MFKSLSKIKVRYAETDQMGIVHHSNYAVWFEVGRTTLIKDLGKSYAEIEKEGVMIPLIRLLVNYKGVAKYDDELTVESYVKEIKGTRAIFGYNIVNESGTVITTGETEHVFTSLELKPINLKKYAPQIFEIISRGQG